MEKITRREFFIDSAKMTGVAICTSTIGYNFLSPLDSQASNDKFPASSCGIGNKKGHRVLITYASQCGTTGEVAEAIGEVLCQSGAVADTKWIKSVRVVGCP